MPAELRYALGKQFDVFYLSDGDTIAAVENFASFLNTYTCAAINYGSVIHSKVLDGWQSSGTYNNLNFLAKLHLIASVGNTRRMIPLPAPLDIMFEDDGRGGFRVKQSIGDLFADAYSQLANTEYSFQRGALCGSAEALP